MKKLFTELKPFKKQILFIFVMVIGSSLANLTLPLYLSKVINIAIPNKDMKSVFSLGAMMLLFVAFSIFCSVTMAYFSARVSIGIGQSLRSQVFRKVQEFSQSEFDTFSTSSLITRTNHDVIQIQTFFNILLRISLIAPIMAIGGTVMALAKSKTMSMILLIAMPVLLIFIFSTARKIMPLSVQMQKYLDQMNLVIREKLTGIRVTRIFNTEEYEQQRFERVNQQFMQNAMQFGTIMAMMMPGLHLVLYGTSILLIGFGGSQIIRGNPIQIGDVIAILQYVMQIMMSVLMLSMVFLVYPRAAVSAKRITELLDTCPKIQNSKDPVITNSLHGHLSFHKVSFCFPNATALALQDISFESKPGEITAIIGSTGSGKSTLVHLILRYYDVQQGEIRIDGINIKELDLNFLRSKIGFVPQKNFLFRGSIAENLRFGNENLSDDELYHMLKITQSYDFVMEKEDKLESIITQGGNNLSGGQKQRLAITRAIAKKPAIYIFDDSFSALDFKTDAQLRKTLFQKVNDATILLVAQRVSTIKNADRILVLDNGRCVGIGTHQELLQNCTIYQEIVCSQLGNEEVS